jgi:hypothetical protein
VLYQNLLVLELPLAVKTPHFVRFLLLLPHGDGTLEATANSLGH